LTTNHLPIGGSFSTAWFRLRGLVKLGYTTTHPDHRLRSLSSAQAILFEFELYGAVQTASPAKLENQVHRRLSDRRCSLSKEFFEISPADALALVEEESRLLLSTRKLKRNPSLRSFGARLRQLRIEQRLTQSELAKMAKVSRDWVIEAEKGKNIELGSVLKIVDALDCDLLVSYRDIAVDRSPVSQARGRDELA